MTRYSNGANIEREIRKKLEGDGFSVMRSAGSKGVFDIIAYNGKEIKFIQGKYINKGKKAGVSKKEFERIKRSVVPECGSKEIWFRVKGDKEYGIYKVK